MELERRFGLEINVLYQSPEMEVDVRRETCTMGDAPTVDLPPIRPPSPIEAAGALPFPVHFHRDGEPITEYLNLKVMTVGQLKEHCRRFGLRVTGTKQVLVEALQAFSGNRNAWDRHDETSQRLSSSPSGTCWIGCEAAPDQTGASSASSTAPPFLVERSKDIRTPVETEAVLHWAHSIVTKYPYQPPTADLDVLDGHCAPGALAISLPLAASQAPIQEQLTLQRQQVQLLTEIRDCNWGWGTIDRNPRAAPGAHEPPFKFHASLPPKDTPL
ncbi:hypothetical protein PAXINDRAFT_102227 [Paxillus involutus ATCC 200175]|uniref:SAP domain-containing protein n=1 Tax=Paxillus involutus ATCC 200175 TaxID=664439 RepID=A0A0C9TF73_PAXIN|nr:hypothetical protein PAXINDRAFT_102227 [Paxillus involutus ATCC 200175]